MNAEDEARRARDHVFVLETPRLLLRSLTDKDVEALHRLYADWDVAKTLSRITHPFSLEAARQFVGEAQEALVEGSSYVLGMFERRNEALVGVVSLRIPAMDPVRREEERADDARLGILGYAVARPSWGRG